MPKRTTTLAARFLAGWEPAPMPASGPEGLIPAGPPETLAALPPSLCEAGPCRHYHSVAAVLDAERPLDGSATRLHEQTTRACYPSPGIEIELTEAPVLRCSRWEPDQEQARLEQLRADYLRSPAGQEYLASREAATDTTTGRDQ